MYVLAFFSTPGGKFAGQILRQNTLNSNGLNQRTDDTAQKYEAEFKSNSSTLSGRGSVYEKVFPSQCTEEYAKTKLPLLHSNDLGPSRPMPLKFCDSVLASPPPSLQNRSMPPAVGGHYRPNLSNPFNHLPPSHNAHVGGNAAAQYGHQPSLSNFNSHNISASGPHSTFPAPPAHQNGHVNLFGSGLANGLGNFGSGLGGSGTGLASQEAQMGFARVAQQQSSNGQDALGPSASHRPTRIREVWRNNLAEEMAVIRNLIDQYPYISMVSCHKRISIPICCRLLTRLSLGHRISWSRCPSNGQLPL